MSRRAFGSAPLSSSARIRSRYDIVLIQVRARLRTAGPRRPFEVECGIQRRDAVERREVGVGAAIEQELREIEMTVDGRKQQRARAVASLRLVDVERRRRAAPARFRRILVARRSRSGVMPPCVWTSSLPE